MSRLMIHLLKEQSVLNKLHNFKNLTRTQPFSVTRGAELSPKKLGFTKTSKYIKPKSSPFKVLTSEFHTSSRRYVGPYIWIVIKTALKGVSILTGRSFRKWHKSLSHHEKRHLTKKHWKEVLMGIAATIGIGYFLGLYHYETHLQVAPITGRKRFIAFTDEQFEKVIDYEAEKFNIEMSGKMLPVTDPYYNIVRNIMVQLCNGNKDIKEVREHTWKIHIIDDPQVNAQVLPNGNVYVHTGLMKFVSNADELAMVLGHEMAHAILKHAAENLSKVQWVDYFVIMIMALFWAFIPTDGISIVTQWFFHKIVELFIHMPYGRFIEEEADKVGLELAAKACFDIRNGTVFWRAMELNDLKNGKTPEFLSTHPASDKRADIFDHFIPRYLEMMKKCDCPPLPNTDPRNIVPHIKSLADNYKLSQKSVANIERLKLPMSQYGKIAPAALASNQQFDIEKESVDRSILTENKLSPGMKSSEKKDGDNSQKESFTISTDHSERENLDKMAQQKSKTKDISQKTKEDNSSQFDTSGKDTFLHIDNQPQQTKKKPSL